MPTITVRRALAEDVPLILAFLHKKAVFDGVPDSVLATAERLEQTLFGDPPLAYIDFRGDRRSGRRLRLVFLHLFDLPRPPGIWLDDLYVDENERSRGVGRTLLAHLARLARTRGCGRVEWSANVQNERGLAFYRRNGATTIQNALLCRIDGAAIDRLADGQTG